MAVPPTCEVGIEKGIHNRNRQPKPDHPLAQTASHHFAVSRHDFVRGSRRVVEHVLWRAPVSPELSRGPGGPLPISLLFRILHL